MVTVPAAAEAVNRPAAVMVPALADQVTPEAAAPVLLMVALHCDVPLIATVDGLHTTERAKFVEVVEEEEELLVLLPQDVMTNSSSGAMRQQARFFEYSFLIIDTSTMDVYGNRDAQRSVAPAILGLDARGFQAVSGLS
jgi:hypothetical protein